MTSHLLVRRLFLKRSHGTAETDLQALLARMRQRLYPETVPALLSFWAKTVLASGYRFKDLDHLLELALGDQCLTESMREAIAGMNASLHDTISIAHPAVPTPAYPGSVRSWVNAEGATAYIVRLLNEWLPVEVARMLSDESEFTVDDRGLPLLTVATAIERLLVRERFSQETLETLLQPGLLSPESVYPADLELLRDVVLCLLGRTRGPMPPIMPASLWCVTPHSHLPGDYKEAVRHAQLVQRRNREEIYVPIAPARTFQVTGAERLRIGSILVTMDGRWWDAEKLQYDEQPSIIYRPSGQLRIDYSGGHTRLRAPWPEERLQWSGEGSFTDVLKMFGREWRVSTWEIDRERTWLNLVFSRVVPISEIDPAAERASWRLRPASIDIAWAALERAVTVSVAQKNIEAIGRLRHCELIPLGYALVGLAESIGGRQPQTKERIKTQLNALRYLLSSVVATQGRIPWRILPGRVSATFLDMRRYPDIAMLLDDVFDGVPELDARRPDYNRSCDQANGSTSSPHAA